jgi:hypothetical protein
MKSTVQKMKKKWNQSLFTLWIILLFSIFQFQLAFLNVLFVLPILYVLILISQLFQPCDANKTYFLEYVWMQTMIPK